MATRKKTTARKKTSGRTSSKATKDTLVVDFSDTESRGGAKSGRRPHFKEGDYHVKIKKIEQGKSSQKKTPYVRPTFVFLEGKNKGKTIYDDFYLTEKALWRFRNLVEATGIKVPSKRTKVDLKKLVGQTLGISLEDDVYVDDNDNERVTSRVVDTFAESELEEVEEDVDADLDDDEEDEDEDEEYDDEDEDEEDEDEDEEDDEEEDDDDDLEELDVDDI